MLRDALRPLAMKEVKPLERCGKEQETYCRTHTLRWLLNGSAELENSRKAESGCWADRATHILVRALDRELILLLYSTEHRGARQQQHSLQ